MTYLTFFTPSRQHEKYYCMSVCRQFKKTAWNHAVSIFLPENKFKILRLIITIYFRAYSKLLRLQKLFSQEKFFSEQQSHTVHSFLPPHVTPLTARLQFYNTNKQTNKKYIINHLLLSCLTEIRLHKLVKTSQ